MILTINEIKTLFFHRKDVFALQQTNGAYFPEKKNITNNDIKEHLEGTKTIGAYCLDHDNTVKWACIDLDVKRKCFHCSSDSTYIKDDSWKCLTCNKKFNEDAKLKEITKIKNDGLLIFDAFPEFKRMLEFSGRKGYHVWIFFDNPLQASYAKQLVKSRLNAITQLGHEVFPKQTELNETRKYGNLVKIPNALHKVSKQRSDIIKVMGW